MLEIANNFLDTADAWIFMAIAVFIRIGAAAFLLPGVGERSIPTRIKLGLAFALTLIVFPIVQADIRMPNTLSWTAMFMVFVAEASVGLAVGLAIRTIVFALQTGGTIIAQSLSLSHMFGTGVAPEPEPTIGTILTLGGITLALAMGLHLKLVVTLSESYTLLPFGLMPPGQDIADWAIKAMSRLFSIAVTLALPFLVISFMYNLALGLVNKAMPQLMVVFVGMPFITGVGLLMLSLLAPVIVMTWLGKMDATLLNPFLVGR